MLPTKATPTITPVLLQLQFTGSENCVVSGLKQRADRTYLSLMFIVPTPTQPSPIFLCASSLPPDDSNPDSLILPRFVPLCLRDYLGIGARASKLNVVSTVVASSSPSNPPLVEDECSRELNDSFPKGPLIPCSFLDLRWIDCADPKLADPSSNATNKGCPNFGGWRYESVHRANVTCTVLPCIECLGKRSFLREVPCIKYTGHYFLTTLLYSIFLGIFAVDRFCLGQSAMAVGKLISLGGCGIWWLVDIFPPPISRIGSLITRLLSVVPDFYGLYRITVL
ncbi:hypothetical protein L596_029572 [Steinernema carpocapsae]|uniref:TM2 domain-containing protein n=1 Tax=Steinernema carpocapsae TaxID=34508 RepID=A0A4U5LV13_STECR|nr:hypothetical protein L596_029572 [Steinernema carpocapsae]